MSCAAMHGKRAVLLIPELSCQGPSDMCELSHVLQVLTALRTCGAVRARGIGCAVLGVVILPHVCRGLFPLPPTLCLRLLLWACIRLGSRLLIAAHAGPVAALSTALASLLCLLQLCIEDLSCRQHLV